MNITSVAHQKCLLYYSTFMRAKRMTALTQLEKEKVNCYGFAENRLCLFCLLHGSRNIIHFLCYTFVKTGKTSRDVYSTSLRNRLGCFCTHHSLGGSDQTPLLSRKRMDVERRTRRHSKDLYETLPNQRLFFSENLKLRSSVRSRSGQRSKSGVFRLQTVVTSNVAFFAQTIPYVLPRTRRRYWLVKLFHIYPRSRSRSGQKRSPNPKFSNESFDTYFMGHFGRRTR